MPDQGGGDPRPDRIPSQHHEQDILPMPTTPLGPCERCGDGMQRDAEGIYCPSCGNRTNADVQNSRIYMYAPLGEGIGEGPFGLMSKNAASADQMKRRVQQLFQKARETTDDQERFQIYKQIKILQKLIETRPYASYWSLEGSQIRWWLPNKTAADVRQLAIQAFYKLLERPDFKKLSDAWDSFNEVVSKHFPHPAYNPTLHGPNPPTYNPFYYSGINEAVSTLNHYGEGESTDVEAKARLHALGYGGGAGQEDEDELDAILAAAKEAMPYAQETALWNFEIALLERMIEQYPASYKLLPWAAKQIKETFKERGRDWPVAEDYNHTVDIIGQAGEKISELRQQNQLPQGFDVNQMDYHQLEDWLQAYRAENVGDEWDERNVWATLQNGWTVEEVRTPKDLEREGELMGHCVGGYCGAVSSGRSVILSLRDPKGMPHVTMEYNPRYDQMTDEGGPYEDPVWNPGGANLEGYQVMQIQGKSDSKPIPEYRAMINEFNQDLQAKGIQIEWAKGAWTHPGTDELNKDRLRRENTYPIIGDEGLQKHYEDYHQNGGTTYFTEMTPPIKDDYGIPTETGVPQRWIDHTTLQETLDNTLAEIFADRIPEEQWPEYAEKFLLAYYSMLSQPYSLDPHSYRPKSIVDARAWIVTHIGQWAAKVLKDYNERNKQNYPSYPYTDQSYINSLNKVQAFQRMIGDLTGAELQKMFVPDVGPRVKDSQEPFLNIVGPHQPGDERWPQDYVPAEDIQGLGAWKLARTTMYHVTRVQNRDAIREKGLLASPKQESPWLFGSPGTYLWDTPQNAHLYAQKAQTITDPDIWAVDVTGLNLQEDPFFTDPYELEPGLNDAGEIGEKWSPYPTPGYKDVRKQYRGPHKMPGAFVTRDNIPPDRLHLAYPNPWHQDLHPELAAPDYWNEEKEQFDHPLMLQVNPAQGRDPKSDSYYDDIAVNSASEVTEEEIPENMLEGYRSQFSGTPVRLAIYRGDYYESQHPYFKPYPGLDAFVDLFYNDDTVAIGFLNVEPNAQGQGLARQLIQEVYNRFPGKRVVWGKSMDDRIDHLKEQFGQQYPDRTAEWKFARTTLYHVSPRANRESIQTNGIDPDYSDVWGLSRGKEYFKPYPYSWFFADLRRAQNLAENSHAYGRPMDIWMVDGSDIHLQSDPHGPYPNAFASQDRIPPDRLLDVIPYEGGGDDKELGREWFPDLYSSWKYAASAIPANYTEDDPLDLEGKQPVFKNMQTEWWDMPTEDQKQAIINAFRATMLSPRLNLKNNAIMYQEFMSIPPEESDPEVFEDHARQLKERWDRMGQGDLMDEIQPMGWEKQTPGKLVPGFWGNIRRLAALGPYAEDLREAAITDMYEHNGTGKYFREQVLKLGIPGVGPKVASFAWLALNPTGSDLGTLDVWMMRHLNQDVESPNSPRHYFDLEDQLRDQKDALYGPTVPLGQYQWGVWDKIRTPGYHQDHSALRAYDPTPYWQVAWPPQTRAPRPQQLPELHPEQGQLFAKEAKHVDVNVQWDNNVVWGMPGLKAIDPEGKTVGGFVISAAPDRVRVDHAEVDPEYRDSDVFMQLAGGLVRWMHETENVKPIEMQTIYPGVKRLVDRWNTQFQNLPENLHADVYTPEQVLGDPNAEFNLMFGSAILADVAKHYKIVFRSPWDEDQHVATVKPEQVQENLDYYNGRRELDIDGEPIGEYVAVPYEGFVQGDS
jgi:GNAT superfamily N-acetyltransferase